jgi:hypothetical protein
VPSGAATEGAPNAPFLLAKNIIDDDNRVGRRDDERIDGSPPSGISTGWRSGIGSMRGTDGRGGSGAHISGASSER